MILRLLLLSLLLFIPFMVVNTVSAEIFTDSGLVDIPTGEVLGHGVFGAGVYASIQNESSLPLDSYAFRVNFGLFDHVEFGLSNLMSRESQNTHYVMAHIKAQLLKESGVIPHVSVGVENLGDKSDINLDTYQSQSVFLSLSKTFNLPRIHLISGHIGIGNHRFAFDDRAVGAFAGISTAFNPAFARGRIALSLEYDGKGVNAGLQHIADSGLRVALGFETLNKPEEIRFLASVSWSNAEMMDQIERAKRLALQAAKLASQTKRTSGNNQDTSQ